MNSLRRILSHVFRPPRADEGNGMPRPRFRVEFLPREPTPPTTPGDLLVACGERNVARLIEVNLVRQGWRVETVATAAEALWCIRQRLPSLFLCDTDLPGASGLELVEMIRRDSALHDLPVILLLPNGAGQEVKARARELTDAALTKPFNPVRLIADVRAILRPCRIDGGGWTDTFP